MKVTSTLTGDLTKNLANLPNAVSRKVQIAALKKGAAPIQRTASSLAPRGQGAGPHLADHIIVSVPSETRLGEAGLFDTAAVEIGPAMPFFWGYFQEFGTAVQPAQPFMRPAFDGGIRQALAIAGADAWEAIRKVLGLGRDRSTTGGNL